MAKTRAIPTIAEAFAFLLLLLGIAPAEAQRARATGPVMFYAAPAGVDANNNCLSAAAPCTLQGAFMVMQYKWDFAGYGCAIKLTNGAYPELMAYGQFVGAHVCNIWGHVDQNGACIDRRITVVKGIDVQDLMELSIACLTIREKGIFARQHVVVDLADMNCGAVPTCVAATVTAVVNSAREFWLSDNIDTVAHTNTNAYVGFNGAVVVQLPITVTNWAISARKSTIEFAGGPVGNQQLISGAPQCYRDRVDDILSAWPLPCTMTTLY